jgi:hypothetical protein
MPEPERFAFAPTRATNTSSPDDLRQRRIGRRERKSPRRPVVAAKYAGGREGKDYRVEQPIDRYRNAMKEENNVVQTGLPEVCCKKVNANSLKTRD